MPVEIYTPVIGQSALPSVQVPTASEVVKPIAETLHNNEFARMTQEAINEGLKTGSFFKVETSPFMSEQAAKMRERLNVAEFSYFSNKLNQIDSANTPELGDSKSKRDEILETRKKDRASLLENVSYEQNKRLLLMTGETQDIIFEETSAQMLQDEVKRDHIIEATESVRGLKNSINSAKNIKELGVYTIQAETQRQAAVELGDLRLVEQFGALLDLAMGRRIQLHDDGLRQMVFGEMEVLDTNSREAALAFDNIITAQKELYQAEGDTRTPEALTLHLESVVGTALMEGAMSLVRRMPDGLSPSQAAEWKSKEIESTGLYKNFFLNQRPRLWLEAFSGVQSKVNANSAGSVIDNTKTTETSRAQQIAEELSTNFRVDLNDPKYKDKDIKGIADQYITDLNLRQRSDLFTTDGKWDEGLLQESVQLVERFFANNVVINGSLVDYTEKGYRQDDLDARADFYTDGLFATEPPRHGDPKELRADIMNRVAADESRETNPEFWAALHDKVSNRVSRYYSGTTKMKDADRNQWAARNERITAQGLLGDYITALVDRQDAGEGMSIGPPGWGFLENMSATDDEAIARGIAAADAAFLVHQGGNLGEAIDAYTANSRLAPVLGTFQNGERAQFVQSTYVNSLPQKVREFQGQKQFFENLAANSQGLLTVRFAPPEREGQAPYVLDIGANVKLDEKQHRMMLEAAVDNSLNKSDSVTYDKARDILSRSPMLSQMSAWHESSPSAGSARIFGKGTAASVQKDMFYHNFGDLEPEAARILGSGRYMKINNAVRDVMPRIHLDSGAQKSSWQMYAPYVASILEENSDLADDKLLELVREEVTGKFPTSQGLMTIGEIMETMKPYLYHKDPDKGNNGQLKPTNLEDLAAAGDPLPLNEQRGLTLPETYNPPSVFKQRLFQLSSTITAFDIVRRDGKTLFRAVRPDQREYEWFPDQVLMFSVSEEN